MWKNKAERSIIKTKYGFIKDGGKMAEIRLENVSMVYEKGNVQALKNIDLDIKDHEFLVLLGPSGCGKSTMLRIISGLISQTEGKVFFDGQDMAGTDARERNVAMVFQSYALYPHLNVYKNIAFPLGSIRGMKKEEIAAKVEEVAEILDVTSILNRRPRELSGGQRQRVALGRAMVRNPVVFLLDEPLSNLDTKMRAELRDVIADVHKRLGTTFVYVTHDQSEAMQLGDRIAVMENGVIRQVGKPQEVYNCPNCVYVASFVGSPRMNFFAARFVKKEDSLAVRIMGHEFPLPEGKVSLEKESVKDEGRVIAGIRPEDFKLSAGDPEYDISFPATAEKTVPMGAGLHVEFSLAGTAFLAVLQNHTEVNPGDELCLHVDSRTIHLFDPETEERI